MSFSLNDYDYILDPELIAQHPVEPRHASKLMVVNRHSEEEPVQHRTFIELPDLLNSGDLLVVNQTRVIPARLSLHKSTGGSVEVLLERPVNNDNIATATQWQGIGKPGKAFVENAMLYTASQEPIRVVSKNDMQIVLESQRPMYDILQSSGALPLPPYIERTEVQESDHTHYQTLFAQEPGAVAAPTASLHFTPQVLEALQRKNIQLAYVTLHVGLGTFLPIRREHEHDIRQHTMHAERYHIPPETLQAIQVAKQNNKRVIAVGTTVCRTLETYAQTQQTSGDSSLFIYPPFAFQVINGLITNFHLPRSTLLLLVSAFATPNIIQQTYQQAIQHRYRFFSYGDAMLLL